jgi:hypothetical protein
MNTLVKKVEFSTFNRKPVVVMSTAIWEKMQKQFSEMQEDLEMYSSQNYKDSIARARKSKKLYTSTEARKKLGLI